MSERLRTIVWLLVLVAGIGATAVQWDDPDAPDVHDAGEAEAAGAAAPRAGAHGHAHDDTHRPARLFAWDVPDVAALTMSGGGRSRRFVADERGWREVDAGGVAVPDTDGTPAFDAAAYLSLFSQARADRVLAPAAHAARAPDDADHAPGVERAGSASADKAGHAGADPADDPYDLASPALRLDVVGRDDQPLARITVGARTPDGYGRYVRLASRDAVLIVPEYQFRPAMEALRIGEGR
ncbi:MAG: hypothetical protein QM674_03900 [Burkholderiaceae bacterium]